MDRKNTIAVFNLLIVSDKLERIHNFGHQQYRWNLVKSGAFLPTKIDILFKISFIFLKLTE